MAYRYSPHPAILMASATCYLICLLSTGSSWPLLGLAVLCLGAGVALSLPLLTLIVRVLKFWPVLAISFVIHAVVTGGFSGGGTGWLDRAISTATMAPALFFTGRLVLFMLVSAMMFEVHSPQEYGREIGRLFAKLSLGRSIISQIELLITLSLRFIPFLQEQYQRIELALVSRGMKTRGSLAARGRFLHSVTYPLFVSALRRSDGVSLALQARGYDPTVRRTYYAVRRVSFREIIFATGFVGACIGVLFLR